MGIKYSTRRIFDRFSLRNPCWRYLRQLTLIYHLFFMLPWCCEKTRVESCPKNYLKQAWVVPGQPSTTRRLNVRGIHRKRGANSKAIPQPTYFQCFERFTPEAGAPLRPARTAGFRKCCRLRHPDPRREDGVDSRPARKAREPIWSRAECPIPPALRAGVGWDSREKRTTAFSGHRQ